MENKMKTQSRAKQVKSHDTATARNYKLEKEKKNDILNIHPKVQKQRARKNMTDRK